MEKIKLKAAKSKIAAELKFNQVTEWTQRIDVHLKSMKGIDPKLIVIMAAFKAFAKPLRQ